jgi:hypothetical protein
VAGGGSGGGGGATAPARSLRARGAHDEAMGCSGAHLF